MNILRHCIGSALTLVFLSGCAFMSEGTPQQNYVLTPPVLTAPQATNARLHIKVLPVEVASGLDTPRIALLENNVRLSYLADAKWAEPLPQMLQFLWVSTLSQSGLTASTSSDNTGAKADRLLHLTATAFHACRQQDGALTISISYEIKLLAPLTHAVLAVEHVAVTQNTDTTSLQDVMISFNRANTQAITDMMKKLEPLLKLAP